MSFVWVTDTEGKSHYIHTSQIVWNPKRKAKALGNWRRDVWERVDKESRK